RQLRRFQPQSAPHRRRQAPGLASTVAKAKDGWGMRTIVMGGGLAGLTAAADLADAGAQVLLLEKRPVLGGKVSSWVDGEWSEARPGGDPVSYPVESGLHVFFGCYRELLAMMRRVRAYEHILR